MEIVGIEGLTNAEVDAEVRKGARFVVYGYCISVLVMTFRRSSSIHFVRAGESRLVKGLPYTVLSLFLGWWGFPWGFIYTPMVLIENLGGGRDVTQQVLSG